MTGLADGLSPGKLSLDSITPKRGLSPVDEIFARLAALSDTELAAGVRLLPDHAPVEAFSEQS